MWKIRTCKVYGKMSDECCQIKSAERSVSPRISPIAVHSSTVVLTTPTPGVN